MNDTQNKKRYCQLSLGLLYENSTEYKGNEEVLESVNEYTEKNNDVYFTRREIVEHPFGYFKRSLGLI